MIFSDLLLLDDPTPHDGALNMALDEVLLGRIERPLLRFYRWARPAVSFGYFIRQRQVLAEWRDREPVRRWTGGGVVPHGEDVTYSLLVPRGHIVAGLSAPECYRVIHAAVAQAYGTGASLAPTTAAAISKACFENPAESDVLEGERKIAGAAQRRTRMGLLHQGSVQLGQPSVEGEAKFRKQLTVALAERTEEFALDGETLKMAVELAAAKYGSEAWLRRY